MRLSAVSPGDIVECDVRGRRFYAFVTRVAGSEAEVNPFHAAITYRHVTARQVIQHWRKAGRKRNSETEATA
jgi:hypothetical protein